MELGEVLAIWLHTIALVIAWGYYGILGRIVLPALERSLGRPGMPLALLGIERRAAPLIVLSAVLFTLTGTYLLVIDPQYAGLGNVAASSWTLLMLAKHVLVIGFVGVAVAIDLLIRRIGRASDQERSQCDLRWIRFGAEGATGLGAFIALLTAVAQAVA
jgi:uncharacterized membrane protein